MLRFTKAHAYGNDFLYVRESAAAGRRLDVLAREMCDRHTGAGADGLILFDAPVSGTTSMRLFNADGGRAEVSGNGLRGLAALLLRDNTAIEANLSIQTDAGPKRLTRIDRAGTRHTFRAAMGLPRNLERSSAVVGSETVPIVVMDMGNPQCIVLGALPDEHRFRTVGAGLERHAMFPAGTNVEFARVVAPDLVTIRIWERGVGPTLSSGTGSCASLVAAAAFGGAARTATVVAPGGSQRVEWRDDDVYLTGWAEILFDGEWLLGDSADRQNPPTNP
ncbi:MAG TPA: diaminopimelate epimerase [Vicinamibacterales bacterium]|jgi:diaminopimelate epimerase|nr:diaminopimelate epimerase [Vicinamibacterales bacterium]